MSGDIGTRVICGVSVQSYVASLTEEEKKEIVEGVLRICMDGKKRGTENCTDCAGRP